jgi:hypothetical protein
MHPANSANYAILDSARMGHQFEKAANLEPSCQSLYSKDLAKKLRMVAPYLFPLRSNLLKDWLANVSVGQHWGIYLDCDAPRDSLRLHLKKFLLIKTDNRSHLYFRFYDPRVLESALPNFTTPQLVEFFGPIKRIFLESKLSGHVLQYRLSNRILETTHLDR